MMWYIYLSAYLELFLSPPFESLATLRLSGSVVGTLTH